MKRSLLILLAAAIAAPDAAAAQDLAVDREFALRALAAERGIEGVTRAAAEAILVPIGGPDWAREFAALDAVHRAGGLDGDGVGPARREVEGPALRVLVEPDPGRLAERLLAALDAPHLAWREAALRPPRPRAPPRTPRSGARSRAAFSSSSARPSPRPSSPGS